MLNLGILISGRGSNMQAILREMASGSIPAKVAVVISNKADAAGLEIARSAGVPTEVVPSKGFVGNRAQYDTMVMESLAKYGVTPSGGLVCLAGFMRIISPEFIDRYPNRIMNIHPALLPSFPGLDAQEQAIKYGVKWSGVTVHFADAGVDTGPIILQEAVPVMDEDTAATLAERILEKEHQIYAQAIRLFAEGRLKIEGRKVVVT